MSSKISDLTDGVAPEDADNLVLQRSATNRRLSMLEMRKAYLGEAQFTPPVDGDFSWLNQGTASVDTSGLGIFLKALASNVTDVKGRIKALPGGNYTLTACMRAVVPQINFANYGLVLRESGSGKLVVAGFGHSGTHVVFNSKYTSPTDTTGGGYVNYSMFYQPWLRIEDNGTNRIFSVSADGVRWIQIHSVGRTDWITADEAGFFVDASQNNLDVGVQLLSWNVG